MPSEITIRVMLYLIPTPVGNLEDMTYRAVRLLKEADLILCEDTRTSGLLLKHFDISGKRLMAHHKFNEHGTSASIVERLRGGETVCLITDAGIEVQTLPGATAFVPALVSSGLPCDRFCFEGFLPQKKGRMTRLKELANEPRTMIIYESPRRIVKTLEQLTETFGADRRMSACREISKVHEESVRGSVSEVLEHFKEHEPKGEFVLIVEGNASPTHSQEENTPELETLNTDRPRHESKYQRKMREREEGQ